MKSTTRKLWSRTRILLWPEEYILASLPFESAPLAAELVSESAGKFAALIVERDEVSLTVEKELWTTRAAAIRHNAVDGPYRVITLQLNVDPSVSGYFEPAARRLAEAGIPIVPQCAFLKDHVLVHSSDANRAKQIMEDLSGECATSEKP